MSAISIYGRNIVSRNSYVKNVGNIAIAGYILLTTAEWSKTLKVDTDEISTSVVRLDRRQWPSAVENLLYAVKICYVIGLIKNLTGK